MPVQILVASMLNHLSGEIVLLKAANIFFKKRNKYTASGKVLESRGGMGRDSRCSGTSSLVYSQ